MMVGGGGVRNRWLKGKFYVRFIVIRFRFRGGLKCRFRNLMRREKIGIVKFCWRMRNFCWYWRIFGVEGLMGRIGGVNGK